MKIIIANYRYFISGGPERYMFNFISAAQKRDVEVIPFLIDNPKNCECDYSGYFAKPRADEVLYDNTRLNMSNLFEIVRGTVWNYDAEQKLQRLIRDIKPDVLYILCHNNNLSPSIIRAAKKEGVRVVHRISDFYLMCPRYDFFVW